MFFWRRVRVKGSGGTDGGVSQFFFGLALLIGGVYFFFDSVRVATGHAGMLSGAIGGGGGRGRLIETTSMGILFVPFFIGIFALFVDARRKWAWGLTYLGLAILAVEILSRIRFIVDTKLTHLLGMFVLIAAGCALIFRSYKEQARFSPPKDPDE
ncbi:hypothetical protein [Aporhodopirellula aestuarii]|uniref:Permease n=1 Tax=Aporhodopirellula aestuarii TaxID=2950107 RepID=A0ABT0U491_9BACT|nr:hypothetical protein [Aporhodopirellula aestuarii]MCM2371703.1 hypothetical protein [Aporhodopirellula aestuarii]